MKHWLNTDDAFYLGRKALRNKVSKEICLRLIKGEMWAKNDKETNIMFYDTGLGAYGAICRRLNKEPLKGDGERLLTVSNEQAKVFMKFLGVIWTGEEQEKLMNGMVKTGV